MKEKSLEYHREPKPGKIAITVTKQCRSQHDLSLAYTPGVAWPCREIAQKGERIFDYTAKANLVAVVTDGTAVLGLGDIGPAASKPVMEGKSLLFKKFGMVDAFDLELAVESPDDFINVVTAMEPTFGGINLEDIASPHCFYIEETLKKLMNIPVFHDDQHGTAVIAGAGILNALELSGKNIENIKAVICGAGAAGVAITRHLLLLGADPEKIYAFDKYGVLYNGREEKISSFHSFMFRDTACRTLSEIVSESDLFIGVSVADVLTQEMVKSMNPDPIIFALANPDPEMPYNTIRSLRDDAFIATGRSDFPNQVNNVLGFPAIFRGALDVRAKAITDNMKVAASRAIAAIAKKDVPDYILSAYDIDSLQFSKDYFIPKPFDKRVLIEVASAVASAEMTEHVHRKTVDIDEYRKQLTKSVEVSHG